jgi:hypothetical protein
MAYLRYVAPLWAIPVIPMSIAGLDADTYLISRMMERDSVQELEAGVPRESSQPGKAARMMATKMMAKLKTKTRKGRESWSRNVESKGVPQQRSRLDRVPLIGQKTEESMEEYEIEVGRNEEVGLTALVANWVQEKISRKRDKYLSWIFRHGSANDEEDEGEERMNKGDCETLSYVLKTESLEDVSRGRQSVRWSVDHGKNV